MNGIGHVDVEPDSGIIESQVCIDEQSGARGRGVTAILKKIFKTFLHFLMSGHDNRILVEFLNLF